MLDLQSEIKLLQNVTLGEFKEFLNRTFLSHEGQVALAKSNRNDLLCEYIGRFVMCDEAQVALAEVRNKEILLLYLEKYKLCSAATKILIEALD